MPTLSSGRPLYAKVSSSSRQCEPVVVVAWTGGQCNNDSYDRWRDALSAAAGTTRVRVMLATSTRTRADSATLRTSLLETSMQGSICDAAFHEQAVQPSRRSVAQSLRRGVP